MSVQQAPLPVLDKSDGTPGSAAPAIAQQVAGTDGTNLRTIKTDSGGNISTISKVDLTPASPATASVGVTSASVVSSNANRKGLVLINLSSNRISLGFGATAVLNSGITLLPGGVFVMDEYLFDTAAVNAIAGGASSTLSIQEYS